MFELRVSANFSAAHQLHKYRGKCARLHGHNWRVHICLRADQLNKAGMVKDARVVRKILNKFLEKIDHRYLNEISFFKKRDTTSENIARYVYDGLKKIMPQLAEVRVQESDSVSVSYCSCRF